LQDVANSGVVLQIAKGKVLFQAGDDSNDVYAILAGRLAISSTGATGREIGFRECSAGDCFGELAALDGLPRSATVTAVVATHVLRIAAPHFRRLMTRRPEMAQEVLRSLALLVRALSDRIADNSVRASVRIVSELVRVAEAAAQRPDAVRVPILPAPTDEDLAARLDSQRESVNRVINELKRRTLVSRSRSTLVVLDLPGLRRHLAELRR
jgi:CRP-like cAMP-binding protein